MSIPEDIQNPARHGPKTPALPDPALSRGLDYMVSKGAFLPQAFFDSMIFCVCLQIQTIRKKKELLIFLDFDL